MDRFAALVYISVIPGAGGGRAEKLLWLGLAAGWRWPVSRAQERTPRIFSVLIAPPDSQQVCISQILSPRVDWEFYNARNVLFVAQLGRFLHSTHMMALADFTMTRSHIYFSTFPTHDLVRIWLQFLMFYLGRKISQDSVFLGFRIMRVFALFTKLAIKCVSVIFNNHHENRYLVSKLLHEDI